MADEIVLAKPSMTATEKIAEDIGALLKARSPLLWIVTQEEERVERAIAEAAARAKFETVLWDCATGVTSLLGEEFLKRGPEGSKKEFKLPGRALTDSVDVLKYIRDSPERFVWVLRDIATWLRDPSALRAMRSLARTLPTSPPNQARAMVVLTPSSEVPPELIDHTVVIKWPLPDRVEIERVLNRVLGDLRSAKPELADRAEASLDRDAAIEAAVGLTTQAAATCYNKSLVLEKMIIPARIAEEKKRVISGKGVEWADPDPRGMAAIGGLENMKAWLMARMSAFSQAARDFGLPKPRGLLAVGVPGCLHGDTFVSDPVDGSTKMVRQRHEEGVPFNVTARNKEGLPETAVALPPRKYPQAKMLRFILADGTQITVTENHRFLGQNGVWLTAFEVCEQLRLGEHVLLESSSESSR